MKIAWIALGYVSVAAGVIGIFLPLIPTTPFLLLAAYAFSKGSDRLHAWLVNHPKLGPPINNWRAHGAISPKAKAIAVASMMLVFGISLLLAVPAWALTAQGVVLTFVAFFILSRPAPPDQNTPPPESQGPPRD